MDAFCLAVHKSCRRDTVDVLFSDRCCDKKKKGSEYLHKWCRRINDLLLDYGLDTTGYLQRKPVGVRAYLEPQHRVIDYSSWACPSADMAGLKGAQN